MVRNKGLLLGAFVLSGVIALSGCAPEAPEAASSPSSKPTTADAPKNELPADIAEVLNNPNRITAEDIAGYSPSELAAFATITTEEAPTPEAFAEQYVTILDAWYMSGATKGEVADYIGKGKNVYEDAMAEKYDAVFKQGLFAEGVTIDSFHKIHNNALNSYLGSAMIDPSRPYNKGHLYKSSEVIDQGDGWFIVDVTIVIADNIEQSSASEVVKRKNLITDSTVRLAVNNIDGDLKVVEAKIQ